MPKLCRGALWFTERLIWVRLRRPSIWERDWHWKAWHAPVSNSAPTIGKIIFIVKMMLRITILMMMVRYTLATWKTWHTSVANSAPTIGKMFFCDDDDHVHSPYQHWALPEKTIAKRDSGRHSQCLRRFKRGSSRDNELQLRPADKPNDSVYNEPSLEVTHYSQYVISLQKCDPTREKALH